MEFFVGWLIFSGLAAWIASSKGRSGVAIFFLSLFFSPLVGIIVALCLNTEEHLERERAARGASLEFRKCPFCAEVIRREAVKCKHCGSEVGEAASAVKRAPEQMVS